MILLYTFANKKPLSVRNVLFIIKQNEQLYDNKRGRKADLCIDKY